MTVLQIVAGIDFLCGIAVLGILITVFGLFPARCDDCHKWRTAFKMREPRRGVYVCDHKQICRRNRR